MLQHRTEFKSIKSNLIILSTILSNTIMSVNADMSVQEVSKFLDVVNEIRSCGVTDVWSYVRKQGVDCCRLHRLVEETVGETGGCSDICVGKHPALVGKLERGVDVCHAFAGQLVLDYKVARMFVEGTRPELEWVWSRDIPFRNKYMTGNFASFELYGRGYCYLRLVEPVVRSRVARILGAKPLIGDVIFAYLFFGFVSGKRLALVKTAPDLWHVVNSRHKQTYFSLLDELLVLFRANNKYRVGMDSMFRDYSIYDRSIGETPPEIARARALAKQAISAQTIYTGDGVRAEWGDIPDIVTVEGSERHVFSKLQPRTYGSSPYRRVAISEVALVRAGLMVGDRFERLKQWFSSRQIHMDSLILGNMLLATSSTAFIKGDHAHVLREIIKLWAIEGDVVMKSFAVRLVLAEAGSVADYSEKLRSQQNNMLAVALCREGFRSLCELENLNVNSKANATVFEAVVGVLSLYTPQHNVRNFLKEMGLFPETPGELQQRYVDVVGDVSVSLNSRQYEKFLELYRDGKFDI